MIDDAKMRLLSNAFEVDRRIKRLNLSMNTFTHIGLKHFVNALQSNRTLTVLEIENTSLFGDDKSEVVGDLIVELMKESNIANLKLSSARIDDLGAKKIAEGLKNNFTLTELNLSRNRIGEEGVKCLSEALKTNNSITTLDLSGHLGGYEGEVHLSEMMKINSSIRQLEFLGQNPNSFTGQTQYGEIMFQLSKNKDYYTIKKGWSFHYKEKKKCFPNRYRMFRDIYLSVKLAICSKVDFNNDVFRLFLNHVTIQILDGSHRGDFEFEYNVDVSSRNWAIGSSEDDDDD
eukprot:TRINITY_DN7933_c0_g1_i1.p1 TRINITY_DN7933_c0_g1~~TRINITY_DN7933_c0_g1_i1.p1  ORF type:complete len:326 (-),score=36.54 TRINITY_DN7933_c0_g1_i1:33-896(-)